MFNIQVIDGAENCTYDIFAIKVEDFSLIYPGNGQDIEFVEDFIARVGDGIAKSILDEMWGNRLEKRDIKGIHGTLFFELLSKKPYYPTKRESEMVVVL